MELKKPKFKKGDRVRTKLSENVFTINSYNIEFYTVKEGGICFKENDLELVQEKVIPKFKKGDKVKLFFREEEFTITSCIKEPFGFMYEFSGDESSGCAPEAHLNLIQEEPRKIIGYKVPFDMYGANWKRGDLAIPKISEHCVYYYIEDKIGRPRNIHVHTVPEEIAKTWEPVYEEVEQPKTIFERVNSFEDACRELGLNFEAIDDITNSVQKLKIICKALNEGWVADWDDHEQNKWRLMYNTTTKELFIESNISLLEMPKSLYLKSEALAKHLNKIAVKELLEFFEL